MAFYVRPKDLLDQLMTENGDGTGNASATAAYSPGIPGEFYIQPPLGEYYEIFSFRFTFTTATSFEATGYGDGASLLNGVKIFIDDGTTVVHDMLAGFTIKTNAAWGTFIDVDTIIENNNNPAALTGETIFIANYGQPIRLFGSQNHRFVVKYEDDMTSRVTEQICSIGGTVGNE